MAVSERIVGGKRRYQAEVFKAGVRVASRRFQTKSAAYSWHEEEKERWRRGVGAQGQKTLAQVMDRFEEERVNALRAATRSRWAWFLKVIRKADIAHVRMADISALDVDGFVRWLLKEPTAKSPNRDSFVKEVRALAIICRFYAAYEDERFVIPVTKRHMMMSRFKPADSAKIRSRDKFIPLKDLREWLECLRQERDPVYRRIAVVQAVMGLRIGEAASLRWTAVDLERGTLTVERTMEWTDGEGHKVQHLSDAPKTESSNRTLPAPTLVLEVLREAKRDFPLSTVVFRNSGGRLIAYESVRQVYNRAFQRAGLKWSATHVLRHTHATLGLGAGRAEAVQSNLGHTSSAQMETYGKAHLAVTNDIPQKVAALLEGSDEKNHVTSHVTRGGHRRNRLRDRAATKV